MKTVPLLFHPLILTVLFTSVIFNVQAKKWVVTVQNYSFTPYNLTHVKAGDTIIFQWVEGVHTTTSTSIPPDALEWDYPITQEEPSAMVIPMVNGTYQYVCTPHAPEMNGTFTVTGAIGISSPGEMKNIRLFPNPAADKINILTTIPNIESLRILDMKGTKVDEMSFARQPGISFRTIDLGSFPSGIFFFEFILESNTKKVIRVVHVGK
jgi:plastocyanin